MASSSAAKKSTARHAPITITYTYTRDTGEVEYCIDQAALDLSFNSSTLEAYFKISVQVSRKIVHYLFVRPEHIRTFDLQASNRDITTTTIASATADNTTPHLDIHVTLYQPPLLVGPRELYPPTPKNTTAEKFELLKFFACTRSFKLGLSDVDEDKSTVFRAFCNLLRESGSSQIKASAPEYSFKRLYQGAGGVIVDVPAPDFFLYPGDDGNHDYEGGGQEEDTEKQGNGEENEDTPDDDACENEDEEDCREENAEHEGDREQDKDNGDEDQQHADILPPYRPAEESTRQKRKQSSSTPSLSSPAKKRRHSVSGSMPSKEKEKENEPAAGEGTLEQNKAGKHDALQPVLDKIKALEEELRVLREQQILAEQPPVGRKPPVPRGRKQQPPTKATNGSEEGSSAPRVVHIYDSDFDVQVLEPRGITIDYPITIVEPCSHFGTGTPLSDYRSLPGLQDTTVWLESSDALIEEVLREYQVLHDLDDNETEWGNCAVTTLLKREPRRLPRDYSRPWRCERRLDCNTKPEPLWEVPPLLVNHPTNHFNFHLRPDCSYWITLDAFSQEYSSHIRNIVHMSQNRFLCPYFFVEFKKRAGTQRQAEWQVAAVSAIALYNRYKLKCLRIENTRSRWSRKHTALLRNYGLVISGRDYKFFCITALLSKSNSWEGCRVDRLFQSSFDEECNLPRFFTWINEIHRWGLTVHGPGCEDDIREYIRRTSRSTRVSTASSILSHLR